MSTFFERAYASLTQEAPGISLATMEAPSVTDVDEWDVMRFLLDDARFPFLFEELGIASPRQPLFGLPVIKLGRYGPPGDIDALIVSGAKYEFATAIECKRVKFQTSAVTNPDSYPNKLKQLEKAVRQTNGLVAMGFHRAFLLVIVQVDARLHPAANWMTRGLSASKASLITGSVAFHKLDPKAGLMAVEVDQPADQPIWLAGGIGTSYFRPANSRHQTPGLTATIRTCFNGGVTAITSGVANRNE